MKELSLWRLFKLGFFLLNLSIKNTKFSSNGNTCIEKKFMPFPSPHSAMNWYFTQSYLLEDGNDQGLQFHPFRPCVVGVVDGSHVPIITPHVHIGDYSNWKWFYFVLLQRVVTSKCVFWNYDIRWASSMHDSNL
jgi:hypothetical protein